MGKRRASKRALAVSGVVASLTALGAGPAGASETQPCGPLTEPICVWVPNQIDNLQAQAEEAKDYAVYLGDRAVVIVNETYYQIRCDVLGECS